MSVTTRTACGFRGKGFAPDTHLAYFRRSDAAKLRWGV